MRDRDAIHIARGRLAARVWLKIPTSAEIVRLWNSLARFVFIALFEIAHAETMQGKDKTIGRYIAWIDERGIQAGTMLCLA